jgi:trehalose utilization protein
VLRNAVNWAFNADRYANLMKAPKRAVENSLEPLVERGVKLENH